MRRSAKLTGGAAVALAGAALGVVLWRRRSGGGGRRRPTELTAPESARGAVVDGIPMRWEEHGPDEPGGVPVVLIHGLPTSPRVWRYVIPMLAGEQVRCLAWEQVGFGRSLAAGLGRDLSIPRQAEYLQGWLRHLGIERAVFVAHDYGGGVLQHLLVARPEMALGVVLTDVVAYDNWPVPAVRLAQAARPVIERLPPALVKPFFAAALLQLGHDDAERWQASWKLHWEPYAAPLGPRAFAHQLAHFSNRDTLAVADRLPRLGSEVPVRVIWGEADPLPVASGARLAAALGGTFRTIPGARHFNPEDHPEVIAEAIREVLAEIGRPAGSPSGGAM